MAGALGDKDVFPTPEMKNEEGERIVYAGPGLTFFEWTVVELAKGLMASPNIQMFEPSAISSMAIDQAEDLIMTIEAHYIAKKEAG